jgi:hypothetical protein
MGFYIPMIYPNTNKEKKTYGPPSALLKPDKGENNVGSTDQGFAQNSVHCYKNV